MAECQIRSIHCFSSSKSKDYAIAVKKRFKHNDYVGFNPHAIDYSKSKKPEEIKSIYNCNVTEYIRDKKL
jgi:hypothetical protein